MRGAWRHILAPTSRILPRILTTYFPHTSADSRILPHTPASSCMLRAPLHISRTPHQAPRIPHTMRMLPRSPAHSRTLRSRFLSSRVIIQRFACFRLRLHGNGNRASAARWRQQISWISTLVVPALSRVTRLRKRRGSPPRRSG